MNGSKTEVIIGDKVYVEKNRNEVVIKQVGFTYVFRLSGIWPEETIDKIRGHIKRQLSEGLVVLDDGLELVSVEPRLEIFVEPQGKPW